MRNLSSLVLRPWRVSATWWPLRGRCSHPGKGFATDPKGQAYVHPKATYIKSIHEPEYLDLLKPQIPYYELINVQMKGYDFAVLEEYTRFVTKKARFLDIEVTKVWATPHLSYRYDNLRAESSLVESSATVNFYERNIQVKHMTSKVAPIFIELIQSAKPPGVRLWLHPHEASHEEMRYIPDLQLAAMEEELEDWKQPLSVLQTTRRKF